MKIITLNTWAGRLKEPLEAFLKERSADTDIFCFQEIFNGYDEDTANFINHSEGNGNLLEEIKVLLPDFDVYFCPVIEGVYGIAIFTKKGFAAVASGELYLYKNPSFDRSDEESDHDRKMQWIHIKKDRKDFIIMNVHGHWAASGKQVDTANHLEQSKIINEFIASTGMTPKILVGDFNLNPTTESIKLLEKHVNNLVVEHSVTSTRTEHYTGEEKHADYIFVSPEIFVEKFAVLPDVVSDHAPLYLEFDVF